ncbi:hypothetical protein COY25_00555 [Candidatus Uhrbacteria bacterium CG_4_10_14_0_2_um_filter_41_7]|uniref:Uncharacterized protein n=1 Tax=Candidatus Uhrbacteria bacterium CG_4_9_14_3_um_filter_41_35 TaxID=1975034 RepID=A0A2M7XDL3_9BACT|nr:MAG: hypothetical protein COV92_03285 [Candidatus Uhrbacteria bacterium CG11_big_fil_rev_8_21_14_0_20_41_9]PIZ55645.1 MAG: hypothetical protein COY25_00555 [Candidatus Uhrbacteria bacterium CG_4_10_14_0_2_um_filter_41_7]PJA45971.1 MAG: hypothetical protein CO173_04045 [Candidatus Uhrbacteria bacterium CG_4_9_14_3_um_filter_41_35]
MGETARNPRENRIDEVRKRMEGRSDRKGAERPKPTSDYFNPFDSKKSGATLDLSNLELPDPKNLKSNQIDVGRANREMAVQETIAGMEALDKKNGADDSFQNEMAGGGYKKPERKPTPAEIDADFDKRFPLT